MAQLEAGLQVKGIREKKLAEALKKVVKRFKPRRKKAAMDEDGEETKDESPNMDEHLKRALYFN